MILNADLINRLDNSFALTHTTVDVRIVVLSSTLLRQCSAVFNNLWALRQVSSECPNLCQGLLEYSQLMDFFVSTNLFLNIRFYANKYIRHAKWTILDVHHTMHALFSTMMHYPLNHHYHCMKQEQLNNSANK